MFTLWNIYGFVCRCYIPFVLRCSAPWQGVGCAAWVFQIHLAARARGKKQVVFFPQVVFDGVFVFSYVVGHGVVVLVYVLRSHFSIMASIFCDFEVLTSAMPDYRWALDNALPGKTSEEKTATWKQVLTCLAYALKREGMKGHKGIENQLILKRVTGLRCLPRKIIC